jgi:hypothetical protein
MNRQFGGPLFLKKPNAKEPQISRSMRKRKKQEVDERGESFLIKLTRFAC